MPKLLIALIILLIKSAAVQAQVDTLHLVKTAGILTPQPIWGFFIKDINSDSIKDFITYSEDHIHIINGADYSLYWSSPAIPMLEKIQFADLDLDGIQDLIVKCGNHIEVLEPPVEFVYWLSPTLDYTYIDFCVGNRNDDHLPDIIIVRKEPFTRTGSRENIDTVWVEAYDGPNFNLEITRIMRFPNYNYYDDLMETEYTHYEYPTSVIIDDFSSDSSESHIIVFANLDASAVFHGFFSSWSEEGFVKILRGPTLGVISTESQGRNYLVCPVNIAGNSYILSLSSNSSGAILRDYMDRTEEADFYRLGNQVRIDSLGSYSGSIDGFNFAGALIDEFNGNQTGLEMCLGGMISGISSNILAQNSIEYGNRIWQRNFYPGIDTILFKYSGPPFSRPQIVLMLNDDIYYRFYDGVTGNLTAVYNPDYYYISQIEDLNGDGIDELIARY
jgi:hypothetical protein